MCRHVSITIIAFFNLVEAFMMLECRGIFLPIKSLNENGPVPECFKVIADRENPVPVCILGVPARPLLGCLMKEFSSRNTTREDITFCLLEWLWKSHLVV